VREGFPSPPPCLAGDPRRCWQGAGDRCGEFRVADWNRRTAPVTQPSCLATGWWSLHGQLEQSSSGRLAGPMPCLCGRAALAHVQVRNHPPLLDGNGRLGRLLIRVDSSIDALRFCSLPLLYLSLFFAARSRYTNYSMACARTADWEAGSISSRGGSRAGGSRCDTAAAGLAVILLRRSPVLSGMGRSGPAFRQVMRPSAGA